MRQRQTSPPRSKTPSSPAFVVRPPRSSSSSRRNDPTWSSIFVKRPLGQPGLEAHAAALFEWTGIGFTGSGSETLALCRHKNRMNAVLAAHGVPVPRAGVFPAIVKPADEDGSAGISADVDLRRCRRGATRPRAVAGPGRGPGVRGWPRIRRLAVGPRHARLRLDRRNALPERASAEYLRGQVGHRERRLRRFAAGLPHRGGSVAARRASWRRLAVPGCASGARGYLRVDIRCNAQGTPLVLDVNPNPELGPGVGICRAVQEAGWTWECFVRRQVEWARDR